MDLLVKQNIIKKNKVVIDIGEKYAKILFVNYEKGKVTIQSSYKVDVSSCFVEGNLTEVKELVRKIYNAINRKQLTKAIEISISVPSYMVTQKIVPIKNTREKDIDKHIIKEYIKLGKVSPATHYIDWAYLGQREENGETINYCMISATPKTQITPMLEEFESRKLKVTMISFPEYNLISLSDLFCSDYENTVKMLIDFGMSSTRIIVVCDGACIYSREIEIGFNTFVGRLFSTFSNLGIPEILNILTEIGVDRTAFLPEVYDKNEFFDIVEEIIKTFQNEIIRIIQLCEEDNISISKIVCISSIVDGMLDFFKNNGMAVETFKISEESNLTGTGYRVISDDNQLDESFGSAIGLCINTLQ